MNIEKLQDFTSRYRRYVGPVLIVLVALLFWWYVDNHPGMLEPLGQVPLVVLPIILLLYAAVLITNSVVTARTIAMNKKTYPFSGSLQLTTYSTLVNFFGPLQSGPGFRAVYLKKKLGLSIKGYTAATTLYYGAFTVINIVLLLGVKYPLLALALIFPLAIAGYLVFRRQNISVLIINGLIIGLVTALQVAVMVAIYYIELHAVGHNASLGNTLAYTASANLALFVSLTPGAIGIRESFLYLAQSLHQVPSETIIAASLLDRAVYIIFLALVFTASSGLHIKQKLTR